MADIPDRRERITFHVDGTDYETHTTRQWQQRKPWIPTDQNNVTTMIPGLILEVLVRPGQRVERGEGVVVLEAMKMANQVTSPRTGTVERILVAEGDNVAKGAVLVELA
jgi:biotin carboxyl carrier protein